MRKVGLEPTRLTAAASKAAASTISPFPHYINQYQHLYLSSYKAALYLVPPVGLEPTILSETVFETVAYTIPPERH